MHYLLYLTLFLDKKKKIILILLSWGNILKMNKKVALLTIFILY